MHLIWTDELFVQPNIIEAYPDVIEYQKGETIKFDCRLSGFGFGEWTRKEIYNGTSQITTVEEKSENDIILSMIIVNSSKNDEGIFVCKGFRNSADYEFGKTR